MSVDVTRLVDIIEPETFRNYTIQRTMELSALIECGIAVNDAEFDNLAGGPSRLINMPYWTDLTGGPEVMDDEGKTKPGRIGSDKDVARMQGWVKSYGANALAAVLSGDDPLKAIGDLFASYWSRVYQQLLLSVLDGVFASESMEDKVHDITGEGNGLIGAASFIDALQKMGDAKDLLTGVMIHSAVEAYLAKNDLIEYVKESEQKVRVPYFMEKRVIVDDAMTFDTETGAAEAYLFGQGAIAWGNGSHPDIQEVETVREGLSLAGEDVLVNRRLSILHPRGVKWTEEKVDGVFPTPKELEDGDNWERVYEPKAIRIVKFAFLTE